MDEELGNPQILDKKIVWKKKNTFSENWDVLLRKLN